jgi:1-acyl-sn-glycerol-3-phosphate acyltransferase
MGGLRLTARVAGLLLALIAAVPLHLLWRLVRLPSPWPRLFLRAVARIIGAKVRVTGRPLKRDVIFVANHLSWTDIPILAGRTGTAFVAKAEVAGVPLVGWLCRLNRTLFVRREERMAVLDQIAEFRAMVAEGWAVTLFPEGTTGDGHSLLPFKATLLAVLDQPPPGVRVQPVRIDYGAATDDVAWLGDERGQDHARRVLGRPGRLPVTLTFLDPFVPEGGRKAIAAEARRRILATGLRDAAIPA